MTDDYTSLRDNLLLLGFQEIESFRFLSATICVFTKENFTTTVMPNRLSTLRVSYTPTIYGPDDDFLKPSTVYSIQTRSIVMYEIAKYIEKHDKERTKN